jgi:GntR family transcriptional regulator/MocR family aminotransferase
MRLQRRWKAAGQLEVDVPDQGMHLVAYLEADRRDIEIETAAARAGLVVRAISRFYRSAPPRPGLMLGFSGYPRQLIVPAASHLATVITGRRPARSPDGL